MERDFFLQYYGLLNLVSLGIYCIVVKVKVKVKVKTIYFSELRSQYVTHMSLHIHSTYMVA